MNKKLCYILPEASDTTHMKYNVEFLESLAHEKNVDIYLMLERGIKKGEEKVKLENLKNKIGAKYIKYTGNSFAPARIIKMLYFLTDARMKGYKKVYAHYSFVGAFLASISNPRKQVYYWNCGLPWNYKRPYLQELYETATYKLIDHFVTGTKNLGVQYAEFYKFKNNKNITIPNWIDVSETRKILEKFNESERQNFKKELNISAGQKVLFFNQRLAERKGAHYIPEILENIKQDVVLIITNDGPYKEKLIEILKEKNLFEKVRMLGRVPNSRVIEILSITDLYILPSEEEGMSHSLMEAMCASVPAVSYDVGGTMEMYPENYKDFCVPGKNIQIFIEKTNQVLENQEVAENLGQHMYEKVKQYDKEIVLNIFIEKVIN